MKPFIAPLDRYFEQAAAGTLPRVSMLEPSFTGPLRADGHTLYDHTSILRFIEWRFLGAPASGPGRDGGTRWWLTKRDRHAHPLGQKLLAKPVNLEVPDPLIDPGPTVGLTPACTADSASSKRDPFAIDPRFEEELARDHPVAIYRPWEQT
jgi:hypothetical protein